MCTQLHERLKQARERRRISLASIARQWGIREQNLELIERDRFEDLPTGLYGRAAVRAYATAVGLPADEVLKEVADRLRSPEDPLDGMARVRGLTRQPERTLKEILHMPVDGHQAEHDDARAGRERHRRAVPARRRLPAARTDGAGGRGPLDRSSPRRGAGDDRSVRADCCALLRDCSEASPGRRSARRSPIRRWIQRWSRASCGCCVCVGLQLVQPAQGSRSVRTADLANV